MHLVDGDLVAEKRNDERKGQDDPVPQPKPKASYRAVCARRTLEKVRSGSAASREAEDKQQENAEDSQQLVFHGAPRRSAANKGRLKICFHASEPAHFWPAANLRRQTSHRQSGNLVRSSCVSPKSHPR